MTDEIGGFCKASQNTRVRSAIVSYLTCDPSALRWFLYWRVIPCKSNTIRNREVVSMKYLSPKSLKSISNQYDLISLLFYVLTKLMTKFFIKIKIQSVVK